MKAFLCFALVAAVVGDQTHHQLIKHGNAPSVSHSVHKPHGAVHASVISQPHASPQSVHGYGTFEKASAAVHAPAALPVKTGYAPAPVYHPAPVYQSAPAYHAPVVAAPTYHAPAYKAPVVAAPAYHAPVVKAPVYHAPVVKAPVYHTPVVKTPAYHAPVVKVAAPAYHAPAPVYKETPEPYSYQYGVADDYSKANFNAAETSDANGAVTGSYSVNLPDGRVQNVAYTADHYNGYIADVSYVGEPAYPAAPAPYKAPAPAYTPAPYKG